jgi:hypothetical protein
MMWITQVFASHQVTGDWQWVTNNMGRAVGISLSCWSLVNLLLAKEDITHFFPFFGYHVNTVVFHGFTWIETYNMPCAPCCMLLAAYRLLLARFCCFSFFHSLLSVLYGTMY